MFTLWMLAMTRLPLIMLEHLSVSKALSARLQGYGLILNFTFMGLGKMWIGTSL